MLEQFMELWTLLQAAAPEAIEKAVVVFVSVGGLRLLTLLKNANHARIANLIFSTLLSGILVGTLKESEVILLSMTSILSASLWEAVALMWNKVSDRIYHHLPAIL